MDSLQNVGAGSTDTPMRTERVLILGDGDFSFTRACLQVHPSWVITATEFGTPQDVSVRYFGGNTTPSNTCGTQKQPKLISGTSNCSFALLNKRMQEISSKRCRVALGVDATKLAAAEREGSATVHWWRQRQRRHAANELVENANGGFEAGAFWSGNSPCGVESNSEQDNSSAVPGGSTAHSVGDESNGVVAVHVDKFWCPFDRVVFNFPHTSMRGRTTRLVQRSFRAFRACVDSGRFAANVVVEMRLRHVNLRYPPADVDNHCVASVSANAGDREAVNPARELIGVCTSSSPGGSARAKSSRSIEDKSTHPSVGLRRSGGLLRSPYGHESAAADAGFEAQGTGGGIAPSDLHVYRLHGYRHRTTKRASSAGHLGPAWVRVHRWLPCHATVSVSRDSTPEKAAPGVPQAHTNPWPQHDSQSER